jgi:hypothetical protein
MKKIKKKFIKKYVERFSFQPSIISFKVNKEIFGIINEFKNREVLLEDIYLLEYNLNDHEGTTLYEFDSSGIFFSVTKIKDEQDVYISFLYKTDKKNIINLLMSKINKINSK